MRNSCSVPTSSCVRVDTACERWDLGPAALRELTARDDVDVAGLDLPADAVEMEVRVIVAGGVFPHELVQICAALGIQLAFTVYADGQES